MLKEIKFCGRTKSGKFVYGDLIHKDEIIQIRTNKSYRYHEVEPESIRQLVGRDCDGAEVYACRRLRMNCHVCTTKEGC